MYPDLNKHTDDSTRTHAHKDTEHTKSDSTEHREPTTHASAPTFTKRTKPNHKTQARKQHKPLTQPRSPVVPQTVCTSLCSRRVSPQDPPPDPSVFLSPMAVRPNPSLSPDPNPLNQPYPSILRRTISHPLLSHRIGGPQVPQVSNPDPDPRALSTALRDPAHASRSGPHRAQPDLRCLKLFSQFRQDRLLAVHLPHCGQRLHSFTPIPHTKYGRKGKAKRSPNRDSFPDQRPRPSQCQVPTSTN